MSARGRVARAVAALGFGAGVALAGAGCTTESEVDTLPEVSLERFAAPGEQVGEDDGDLYLPDVTGPAVVNLWASWCGPCRSELPVLEDFHEQHGDDVRVLGVDYQDPQVDAARQLAGRSGLSYELVTDPDGTLDGAPPFPVLQGLPFWAFVDADGRVVHREFVEVTSVGQLEDLVAEHLEVRL